MHAYDLQRLEPYFRDGERYLNGTLIKWDEMYYPTMAIIYRLRELLDSKVILIRGPHPDPTGTKPYKRTAVDACAPGVDLGHIAMTLFRFQYISFGLYSGNSFHIDLRPFDHEPARWLAIHTHEEPELARAGLTGLIGYRADGWAYLSWSHPRASEALLLVLALARKQSGAITAEV